MKGKKRETGEKRNETVNNEQWEKRVLLYNKAWDEVYHIREPDEKYCNTNRCQDFSCQVVN